MLNKFLFRTRRLFQRMIWESYLAVSPNQAFLYQMVGRQISELTRQQEANRHKKRKLRAMRKETKLLRSLIAEPTWSTGSNTFPGRITPHEAQRRGRLISLGRPPGSSYVKNKANESTTT